MSEQCMMLSFSHTRGHYKNRVCIYTILLNPLSSIVLSRSFLDFFSFLGLHRPSAASLSSWNMLWRSMANFVAASICPGIALSFPCQAAVVRRTMVQAGTCGKWGYGDA